MADEARCQEEVRDLRALYDVSHELIEQRSCRIEEICATEAVLLAGLRPHRAAQAYDMAQVSNQALWADLRIDRQMIDDAQPMLAALEAGFAEFIERIEQNDPADVGFIAREMIRRSTLAHTKHRLQTDHTKLHDALLLCADGNDLDDQHRNYLASMKRVDAVNRLRYVERYESVQLAFGLRPKEPMDTAEFTQAAISIMEGMDRNGLTVNTVTDLMRPTGPDGAMLPWSMAGVLFESLVLSTMEPDPFAKVSIDFSTWV